MEWYWYVVMFIALIIAIGILQAHQLSNKQKELDTKLKSLDGFRTTQKFLGADGQTSIAIDEEQRKLALVSRLFAGVTVREISYRDLLSAELYEDGVSITSTKRGSQLGGALLGGLLLGGVGILLGGLSAKTETHQGKVRRIDLRLIVNDTKSPTYDICFLKFDGQSHNKDGLIAQPALHQARHWHGLCAALIKQADQIDATDTVSSKASLESVAGMKASIADELAKLADLKDRGALSEAEFSTQKGRLLSG